MSNVEEGKTGNNGDRLVKLLDGLNPTRPNQISRELFADVVSEIKKEKGEETKARAKEHLTKAMDLVSQMEKARRKFDGEYKAMDKTLGKMLGQINGMLTGKSLEEIDQDNAPGVENA